MIGITIFIEVVLLVLAIVFWAIAEEEGYISLGILGCICFIALIVTPIAIGSCHGYINYNESNDRDLARITAVTQ